jgi:C1A family cysteine protease
MIFFFLLFPFIIEAFVSNSFHDYARKFNKHYRDDSDYLKKKSNYEYNIARIKRHNDMNKNYKLGENEYTDEDINTLKDKLLAKNFHFEPVLKQTSSGLEHKDRFFWDKHVSEVKNQGRCGSCWAFSAVGAIESMIAIKYNLSAVPLSEQNVVDCSKRNHGCDGGLMHLAFEDIKEMGGIALEKDYPYKAGNHACKDIKKYDMTKDIDYTFVPSNNLPEMIHSIHQNPLCVAVDANSFEFIFYKEGIFDLDVKNMHLSHAVLLTGYDMTSPIPYWKMKNSWSKHWGEDGYMRLKMTDGKGVIGVNQYVLFPKILEKIFK